MMPRCAIIIALSLAQFAAGYSDADYATAFATIQGKTFHFKGGDHCYKLEAGTRIQQSIGTATFDCDRSSAWRTSIRDIYSLGDYASTSGDSQVYTEGTDCGAINAPRSSKVEVVIDDSRGDSSISLSISEQSTCVYLVTVTSSPTYFGVEVGVPPSLPPGAVIASPSPPNFGSVPGWILADAGGKSCDDACASAGGVCSTDENHARAADFSSASQIIDFARSLGLSGYDLSTSAGNGL